MDEWYLPVAPTALFYDPKFEVEAARLCTLTVCFEGPEYQSQSLTISFRGVEKFLCTYLGSLTHEMRRAYGKIISFNDSELVNDVKSLRKSDADLIHYMITFDDGPCYEFICEGFSVEE